MFLSLFTIFGDVFLLKDGTTIIGKIIKRDEDTSFILTNYGEISVDNDNIQMSFLTKEDYDKYVTEKNEIERLKKELENKSNLTVTNISNDERLNFYISRMNVIAKEADSSNKFDAINNKLEEFTKQIDPYVLTLDTFKKSLQNLKDYITKAKEQYENGKIKEINNIASKEYKSKNEILLAYKEIDKVIEDTKLTESRFGNIEKETESAKNFLKDKEKEIKKNDINPLFLYRHFFQFSLINSYSYGTVSYSSMLTYNNPTGGSWPLGYLDYYSIDSYYLGLSWGYCYAFNNYFAFGPGGSFLIPIVNQKKYLYAKTTSNDDDKSIEKSEDFINSTKRNDYINYVDPFYFTGTFNLQFMIGELSRRKIAFLFDIGGGWLFTTKLGIYIHGFVLKVGYLLHGMHTVVNKSADGYQHNILLELGYTINWGKLRITSKN